ncbi:hypothetical protein HDV02_000485, partial [Globomyces sp. JEL0801]
LMKRIWIDETERFRPKHTVEVRVQKKRTTRNTAQRQRPTLTAREREMQVPVISEEKLLKCITNLQEELSPHHFA